MPLIGAHMSIAGGYYKAVEAAAACRMNCVQLFTKNNNQWRAKAINDEDVERFRVALRESGICHPVSHSSYLINLASSDAELWAKSVDAMVVEIQRAEQLAIPFVIVHPGASVAATEARGLRNVIRALNEIQRQTKGLTAHCLLENTAGQGTCLGWSFEHLARLLAGVKDPGRIGVCIDTCHAFAAGYPLADPKDYGTTMKKLDQLVGINRVKAVHLNDSKRELGSRVDRHEHIGKGKLGLKPFRNLLNDPRFAAIPMYLETPKGTHRGQNLDVLNLRALKRLIVN